MKHFKLSTIIAFIIMLIVSAAIDAKSSSFGGRSSSSSSSPSKSSSSGYSGRSSSSGYSSKSSSSGYSGRSGSSGSSFGGRHSTFSNPGNSTSSSSFSSSSNRPKPIKPKQIKSKPIVVTRDNVLSSIGKKGVTGDQAGLLYKEFQASHKPASSRVVLDRTEVNKIFSPQYRTERRSSYYSGYTPRRSTYMPATSNYGVWDYLMFSAMLDNIGDRQMYYNHQNDPGFQAWRSDANTACLKGDTEICNKLADLDREMAEYHKKGIVPNPNYITPGVDASIYAAQNIDTSGLAPIRVCAGSIGSDYSRFVGEIATLSKLKVPVVESNGSGDNIAKLANGLCDMAFVQDDLVQTSNLTKVLTLNQLEVIGLGCTGSFEHLMDIPENTPVYIGSDQTGSQYTFNQLLNKIPSLKRLKVDTSKSVLQAIGDVATNGGCVFGVSTPESPMFKTMDDTGKLKLVPIMSTDFIDGKPTYKMVNIMDSHYKNLTQDVFKGFGSKRGTDSLAVHTSLITPQSWIDGNKSSFDVLMLNRQALQESVQ